MLQKINGRPSRASILLCDAAYPNIFPPSLEYSSPARGTWNIVHTGMLVPESLQIYIGAAGCLRGVVLTAEEMGMMHRYASLEIKDKDIALGDQENFIVNGTTEILRNLSSPPRAVLVFTSCLHHFMGTDLHYVYRELAKRFPMIDFAPCIMDPIMSKSGMPPEVRERREIYRLLEPRTFDDGINIIGGNLPLDESSETVKLLKETGRSLRDWTSCRTYEEFQTLASSTLNIYYHPFTHVAVRDLYERLGQNFLYLPLTYDTDEIKNSMVKLAECLNISLPDCDKSEQRAEDALGNAQAAIGSAPVAIDASFTFRPFNLARVLTEHGFNVVQIHADMVAAEDEADFYALRKMRGDIEVVALKHADVRLHRRGGYGKILALGQKAAYLNDTPYFVNFTDGGGYLGWNGIVKLAELMTDAWQNEKDTRHLIQCKGWHAPCCLQFYNV